MTGAHATREAETAQVAWLVEGRPHDIFEVVELTEDLLRARSAYLFEVGEELAVQIERGGQRTERQARVRAHVGDPEPVTELELTAKPAPAKPADRR